MRRPPQKPRIPEELVAGTITRIAPQKKDPSRVSVFIDGKFAFGLHQDIMLHEGLHVRMVLSLEDQRRLLDANQYHAARRVTLEYLSYKPRTQSEVRTKLRDKEFAENIIELTISRYVDLGYLDDERYATSFVRDAINVRRQGLYRIARDLGRRGVDPAIVEAITDEVDQTQLLEAARKAADKRAKRLNRRADKPVIVQRKRVTDFLARRGFASDLIRKVVDELTFQPPAQQDTPMARKPSNSRPEAPSADEARALAEKRYDQLTRLESSDQRRRQKLNDFLRRRAVPSDLIRVLVDEVADAHANTGAEDASAEPEEDNEEVQLEEALGLAQTRWRQLTKLEPNLRKRNKKLSDFLARRGYNYDIIGPVVAQME